MQLAFIRDHQRHLQNLQYRLEPDTFKRKNVIHKTLNEPELVGVSSPCHSVTAVGGDDPSAASLVGRVFPLGHDPLLEEHVVAADADVAGTRDVVHHRPEILDGAKRVDLVTEKKFQISVASTKELLPASYIVFYILEVEPRTTTAQVGCTQNEKTAFSFGS